MSNAAERPASPGLALEITVFFSGALVMAYEIVGSRIVAPYLGASTYIWTSLIGVILGALSLGYWLGGRTADRRPDTKVLAGVLFAAGFLVTLTVLVKEIVLAAVASLPVGLEVRSVVAALLLFAPASVALGFVIPYSAKLRIASLDAAGRTVGRLYALSTVGSIVGTFAAGFLFIPFVGSVRTLYIIAASLFVLSAILIPFSFTRANIGVLVLFLMTIAVGEATALYLTSNAGFYDFDTEYSRVRVFEAEQPESGRRIRAMSTDPYSVQSAAYLEGDGLALEYTKYYHLLTAYVSEPQRVLMIGGAGYSFPQDFVRTYPNATIDVVEIDPGMTAAARQHFGLADHPSMNIIHADGRTFLNSADAAKYDAVLVDAFGSLLSVPFHLTTVEAVSEMHRTLTVDGVVIINIGSAVEGDRSLFLQAMLGTFQMSFAAVDVYKVRPATQNEELQNLIIVARKGATDDAQASSFETPSGVKVTDLLKNRYGDEIAITVPPLTDDLAPVEYYNSLAIAGK